MDAKTALPDPAVLTELREFFAAGFFEEPDASMTARWSRAVRRYFENRAPFAYDGERLYPCGSRTPDDTPGQNQRLSFTYSHTFGFSAAGDDTLAAADPNAREALVALNAAMTDLDKKCELPATPHTIGGGGYTHSIPHYGRVVREGLDEHARRVELGLRQAEADDDGPKADFYRAMSDVLDGVRAWHHHLIAYLESWTSDDRERLAHRDRILEAFHHVPFQPARSFFEALLTYNFVFYVDGCDNPGRLDQELYPYYERDLAAGRITRDEALELLRAFTDNVCDTGGYSAAIGGTSEDGQPGYNELTILCLEAVHRKYRPSYELRVRKDMPDRVWEAALDALASGCGQPALYNEEGYLAALTSLPLGLTPEDATWWNGGGCTETMVHGRSNVGSLDAGIHLPLLMEAVLKEKLAGPCTFPELVRAFKDRVNLTIKDIVDRVNLHERILAAYRPQPVRSLLIDDCIERGVEFNAGGARYNWSVVNVAGLSNVVDSLTAVREVVFDKKEMAGPELLDLLARNFDGDEALRVRLTRCPRFGNDVADVDAFAADLAEHVFLEFLRYTPHRGGKFLSSCIMFVTYAGAGEQVGATPDGRRAEEPLADSIGPVQGRDTHGPTAMLRSVARLPLHLAPGTPVLNVRFTRKLFADRDGRESIKDLLKTYFDMGGMQVQISVVDQAVLRDAMEHPEQHEDLIVRIGGFSTHFNWLSPDLQQAVLERTEHAI